MPTVRITNLAQGGLNSDQIKAGLQPGEFDILQNIDTRAPFIAAGAGNIMLDPDQCPVDPYFIYIHEQFETSYIVVSDGTDVYLWDGTTYYGLITGLAGGRITYTVFLGTLIVNSHSDGPYYWSGNIGENLLPLPGWVDGYRCLKMIAYNNYLVAIRQYRPTDDAEMYRVAWSDTAAIGSIPNEWAPTPENNAGSRVLADSSGHLYNAEPMRDALMLYKGDGVYKMTPRNDNLVFDIVRVKQRIGSDCYGGVCEYGSTHAVLTRGDIVLFDGQSAKSVAVGKVRETLFDVLSKTEWQDSKLLSMYARSEIWILLKTAGSVDYDVLLKYDMEFNSFSTKQLITRDPNEPDGVVGVCGWATGAVDVGASDSQWNRAESPDDTWDDGAKINWNDSQFNPSRDDVVFGARVWRPGADPEAGDPDVVHHRELYRTVDGTYTDQYDQPVSTICQKSGMVVATLDQDHIMKRIFPEIEGNMTIGITLGTLNHAGDAIRWGTVRPFRAGLDRAVNVRGVGQPLAIKIESPIPGAADDEFTARTEPENRYWKLNAFTIEFQKAGKGRV